MALGNLRASLWQLALDAHLSDPGTFTDSLSSPLGFHQTALRYREATTAILHSIDYSRLSLGASFGVPNFTPPQGPLAALPQSQNSLFKPARLPRHRLLEAVYSMASPIPITLKLFAAYQEACGTAELSLTVEPGTTVSGLCDRILMEHPELERWRSMTRFGINLEFVSPETQLQAGDEVVFIPPVSGG